MTVLSRLCRLLQNKPAIWINTNPRLPSRLCVSRAVVIADSETGQESNCRRRNRNQCGFHKCGRIGLTKKAEPPPTRDVNPVKVRGPTGLYARDSGTDSANGGWLRRLVRHHGVFGGVVFVLKVKLLTALVWRKSLNKVLDAFSERI